MPRFHPSHFLDWFCELMDLLFWSFFFLRIAETRCALFRCSFREQRRLSILYWRLISWSLFSSLISFFLSVDVDGPWCCRSQHCSCHLMRCCCHYNVVADTYLPSSILNGILKCRLTSSQRFCWQNSGASVLNCISIHRIMLWQFINWLRSSHASL